MTVEETLGNLQRAVVALAELIRDMDMAHKKTRDELTDWQECALYDPTVPMPTFKGWDRSALERCRKNMEADRG